MDEKKPHEETWTLDGQAIIFPSKWAATGFTFEQAKLAAQAPAMARLLLVAAERLARSPDQMGAGPIHDAIQQVLRAAGVLPQQNDTSPS